MRQYWDWANVHAPHGKLLFKLLFKLLCCLRQHLSAPLTTLWWFIVAQNVHDTYPTKDASTRKGMHMYNIISRIGTLGMIGLAFAINLVSSTPLLANPMCFTVVFAHAASFISIYGVNISSITSNMHCKQHAVRWGVRLSCSACVGDKIHLNNVN